MGAGQSLKTSMGRLRHHAYLNRRRTAVETIKRAILQFQEARALLGGSDVEGTAKEQIDGIIRSLTQAICLDLQNVDAIHDTPAPLISKQIA